MGWQQPHQGGAAVTQAQLEHLRLGVCRALPPSQQFWLSVLPGVLEPSQGLQPQGQHRQEQMLPRGSRLLPPGAGKICTADGSWDLLGYEEHKYRSPFTRLFLPFLLKNRKIADPKFNPKVNILTPISFRTLYFRLLYYILSSADRR